MPGAIFQLEPKENFVNSDNPFCEHPLGATFDDGAETARAGLQRVKNADSVTPPSSARLTACLPSFDGDSFALNFAAEAKLDLLQFEQLRQQHLNLQEQFAQLRQQHDELVAHHKLYAQQHEQRHASNTVDRICHKVMMKQSAAAPVDPASSDDDSDLDSHYVDDVSEDHEDAFFLVDLGVVERQYRKWNLLFPRITPFYAVKCNPDKGVIRKLARLGCNFDCASSAEISLVASEGVDASRIVFANPCKARKELLFAKQRGIDTMTFDNAEELHKIKALFPEAKLLLRIFTPDSHSLTPLGSKFGAAIEQCPKLLRLARQLELDVIGVSFHVGSGCYDKAAYVTALELAHSVFEFSRAELGKELSLLDIGGGFPGVDDGGLTIAEVAATVNPVVERLFSPSVRVIAEPGRYFVEACCSLAVQIHSRRKVPRACCPADDKETDPASSFCYYISEGVHGVFKDALVVKVNFEPSVLPLSAFRRSSLAGHIRGAARPVLYHSKVYGPSGDSRDLVASCAKLPELRAGEWLYFKNMGAYTMALASRTRTFGVLPVEYI